jgi:peptide/nickel transport system permease protein
MRTLLIRRLLLLPLMLITVSGLIFVLPYLTGIDPAAAILRARVPERAPDAATLQRLRTEFGLDQPLVLQYVDWLSRVVRGDLGYSYVSRAPVHLVLGAGFQVTFVLTVAALALAVLLGLPLGIMAALRPGRWLDGAISVVTQAGVALPEYWVGPVLILVFAQYLGWLPSSGWRDPQSIILPMITLALGPLAYCTRLTRDAMIDVLHTDYVRTARAKGLAGAVVVWRHALPNTLIPIVTLMAIWFAGLLGGSVIVEVIFALPGLGRILYDAVIAGDIPLIQAGLLLIVSLAVLINTLADVAYGLLNPHLRLSHATR